MTETRDRLDDEDALPRDDEQDLTPPAGEDLRSEETFGRTDRYANLDDETAERTKTVDRLHEREEGAD